MELGVLAGAVYDLDSELHENSARTLAETNLRALAAAVMDLSTLAAKSPAAQMGFCDPDGDAMNFNTVGAADENPCPNRLEHSDSRC